MSLRLPESQTYVNVCLDSPVRVRSLDHVIVNIVQTFRPLAVDWDHLQINKTTKFELNISLISQISCFTRENACYGGHLRSKSATHFDRPYLIF
jgi:hypothetical protein